MNGNDKQQQRPEPESFYKQAPAKVPKEPDLAAKMIMQPRSDPFTLMTFDAHK